MSSVQISLATPFHTILVNSPYHAAREVCTVVTVRRMVRFAIILKPEPEIVDIKQAPLRVAPSSTEQCVIPH